MAFDFDRAFADAVAAGVDAARPGGQAAQEWIRESAEANQETLRIIAEGVKSRDISKQSAAMLLKENAKAMKAEAAALSVMIKASAQAAANAFMKSLGDALSVALKIPL